MYGQYDPLRDKTMTDLVFDKHIVDATKAVEKQEQDEKETEEEKQTFQDPRFVDSNFYYGYSSRPFFAIHHCVSFVL